MAQPAGTLISCVLGVPLYRQERVSVKKMQNFTDSISGETLEGGNAPAASKVEFYSVC